MQRTTLAERDLDPLEELTPEPEVADLADAPALAELFRSSYQTPNHPARDPGWVRASIRSGELWMVVRDHERIVGCLTAAPLPWTGTVELRAMAVAPDVRKRHLAGAVYLATVRHLQSRSDWELLVANTRLPAVTHFGQCPAVLPMAVTGHDGGSQFVDGRHEVHVTMSGPNRYAMPSRAAAVPGSVASRLMEAVDWDALPPEHPADPLAEHVVAPQAQTWWTDEFPHLANGEASIPAIAAETGAAALAEVVRRVQGHDQLGVHHVSAVVPASHEGFLRDLCGLGFRPTAFLPAWYADGGVRHDCVLMARWSGNPATNGQDNHIDRWDQLLTRTILGEARPGDLAPPTRLIA